MHPLHRMMMGYFPYGLAQALLPRWRAPKITDVGLVTRQTLRHLDRKQPDLAAAIRSVSSPPSSASSS